MRVIDPKTVGKTDQIYFSDYSGYRQLRTRINAVWENYLDVVDLQYYLPAESEADITKDLKIIQNGKNDVDVV